MQLIQALCFFSTAPRKKLRPGYKACNTSIKEFTAGALLILYQYRATSVLRAIVERLGLARGVWGGLRGASILWPGCPS